MSQLPETQREVFVLVEIEGLRPADDAESLELETPLVHSRLRSARNKFREFCSRRHEEEAV